VHLLTNGECTTHHSLTDFNLIDIHGAPPGSTIITAPSGYMMDKAWEKVVPAHAFGIRNMPVIGDHPDWCVFMTLDGFGSHVSVHIALKIFHDHNSMIVKDDANNSLLNQRYDQHVAICDNVNVRKFLDLVRRRLPVICQWTLIVACIAGFLTTGSTNAWKNSFKRVNLHLHFHVPFEEWMFKTRQHIDTGTVNFQVRYNFWFDDMPAFKYDITFGLMPCQHNGGT
jgi:hypothetical protein